MTTPRVILATASALLMAGSLGAQQPAGTLPPLPSNLPPAGVTVQAVVPGANNRANAVNPVGTGSNLTLSSEYSRQTFDYPRDARMDPIQPPASIGVTSNEEDLSVAGIVMNSRNPRQSRAMIRARGFSKTRYAVGVGDKIDQYTVTSINATAVTLSVPVLGGRKTLVLQRSRDAKIASGVVAGGANGSQTVVTEVPTAQTAPVANPPVPQTTP